MLANLFFKDTDPSPQTLGEASWLYQDIMKTFSMAVQNGVAKAFKGKE
ncbi:MAG: hypothetical protein V7785_07945 [Bermanella sp.]